MRHSDRVGRPRLYLAALALGAAACHFEFDRVWIDSGVARDAQWDRSPGQPDGGIPPDGPRQDRGVDPPGDGPPGEPRICVLSVENAKDAPCAEGWATIAGGGDCRPNLVKSSKPHGDGWRVECEELFSNQPPPPHFTDSISATCVTYVPPCTKP